MAIGFVPQASVSKVCRFNETKLLDPPRDILFLAAEAAVCLGQTRNFPRWPQPAVAIFRLLPDERLILSLRKFNEKSGEARLERRSTVQMRGSGFGDDAVVLLVSAGKNNEKWAIPGGGVEKDENHEEAASRELEEEAGVRADPIERLGVFQDDVKQYRTTVFLMRVKEELDEWEEGQFGRKRLWVPIHEGEAYLKNSHRPYLHAIITGAKVNG